MSKKKIILIVCIAVAVIASAVATILFVTKDNKEIKTPIPQSIEVSSADTAQKSLSDSPVSKQNLTLSEETDNATLCAETYKLISYVSDETYIKDDGITAHNQKINEYFKSDSDFPVYTIVIDKELSATYDKSGKLVRSSGDYSPETDYYTENIVWFYKDGALSCCEMSFTDVNGNFGTAYYNADGTLSCVVTEIYSLNSDNEPTVEYTYYDSTFNIITKEAFLSLIPKTDADNMLYINWQ